MAFWGFLIGFFSCLVMVGICTSIGIAVILTAGSKVEKD